MLEGLEIIRGLVHTMQLAQDCQTVHKIKEQIMDDGIRLDFLYLHQQQLTVY